MECACKYGYLGSLCENKIFCPHCRNNECDLEGKCVRCKEGWTGNTCDKRTCMGLDVCNGHGRYNLF